MGTRHSAAQRHPQTPQPKGMGAVGRDVGRDVGRILTFGWEPSAMVDSEKLSLCSSDGVRYLQGDVG